MVLGPAGGHGDYAELTWVARQRKSKAGEGAKIASRHSSGKPHVYLFMLFLLFLLMASKKSKFLKSITCLGKAIPCTFYILFFSFLQIN